MNEKARRAPRRPAVLAAGLVASLATAAAAYAGIVAMHPSDVITACKSEANGNVRIVDDASECRNNEVSVTWSTEGPPGPPGPPGEGALELEYVTRGPDTGSQQAVEAVCSEDLDVIGGAVRNRTQPGTLRASHPSDGSGSGQHGSRGWYGVVEGGFGSFSVVAICAPAASIEFRSAGGQYGG